MPNTKSAKKRLRTSQESRAKNRAVKSTLKSQIKKVLGAVESGDATEGAEALREVSRRLDRAAGANVIHPNRAARLKSRLSKHLKAAKAKV